METENGNKNDFDEKHFSRHLTESNESIEQIEKYLNMEEALRICDSEWSKSCYEWALFYVDHNYDTNRCRFYITIC